MEEIDDLIQNESTFIINKTRKVRKEILFNYCDSLVGEISYSFIDKIYNSEMEVNQIKLINDEEFASYYGFKKPTLLKTLKNNYEFIINQSYSIHALYGYGLSKKIIDLLIEKGFKKLHELIFITKEELSNVYNLHDSTVNKILNAIDKCNLNIDDFSIFYDFLLYYEDRSKNKLYIESFKRFVTDYLSSYDYPISINYLKRNIPKCFDIINYVSTLKTLEENKVISINDECVEIFKPTFEEFAKNLPDTKQKYIFFKKYYLDNKTLQEIGDEYNVTRENIRQKISKVDIPKIKEEEYAYYFKNYNLSNELFHKVFNLSYPVIKYLKLQNKKGDKTINDLLEDENLNDDIRERVMDNLDKLIVINGEKVASNKTGLLKYVLKEVCNCGPYSIQEIIEKHNELAVSINHPELMMDDKYFHSHFISHRYVCISSLNGDDESNSVYRYLDKESNEIKMMITKLKLDDYKDVEITSTLIYKANITLMIENDIRNEYELHSILRYNITDDYIIFGRNPVINFGNGNRDRQILDLIVANSPIKTTDLADMLSETYGYNKNSIQAYASVKFNSYYDKGYFDTKNTLVDYSAIDKLKKYMVKDIYFFEDIFNICEKNNIDYSPSLLSKYSVKQLGYISNGSYMFKKEYTTFINYIKTNFFNKDFENLNSVDSRITNLVMFNMFYLNKIKKPEYIEYKFKEFISVKKLESFGITKEDLEDFSKQVYDFVDPNCIFTTEYLKNIGFKHKLFTYGFEDIFYDSILISSNLFKMNRSGIKETVFVHIDSKNEPTVSYIINQIMGNNSEMSLSEIIDKFKIYGKKSNILEKYKTIIQGTNLTYDAESKKIIKKL